MKTLVPEDPDEISYPKFGVARDNESLNSTLKRKTLNRFMEIPPIATQPLKIRSRDGPGAASI